MKAFAVAAALLACAVPLARGGWGQEGGDAGHTGVVDEAAGAWDIAARFDVLQPGYAFNRIAGPGLVDTPYGPTGLARDLHSNACEWVRVADVRSGGVERRAVDDAPGCMLAAYSARHDLLIMCRADRIESADVRAYDAATLRQVWRTSMDQVGFAEAKAPTGAATGLEAGCELASLDEATDEFVAPFAVSRSGADYATHRIASLDVGSGAVRWSTTVPLLTVARSPVLPALPGDTEGGGTDWAPLSVTLTPTGVFVVGLALCPDLVTCDDPTSVSNGGEFLPLKLELAWLDRGGVAHGSILAEGDPSDAADGRAVSGHPTGSLWGTANGNLAYELMGDQLVVVDPETAQPVSRFAIQSEGLPPGFIGTDGPGFAHGLVLLPLKASLTALRPETGEPVWTWPGFGGDWAIDGPILSPAGQTVVFTNPCTVNDGKYEAFQLIPCPSRVAVLDGATGRVAQVLDGGNVTTVELSEPGFQMDPTGSSGAQGILASYRGISSLLPTQGGILAVTPVGSALFLAHSDPALAPRFALSSLYPGVGDAVTVTLDRAAAGAARLVAVQWGDGDAGLPVAWPAGEPSLALSHRYLAEGDRTALVTLHLQDGTTRTRSLAVHVGGTPAHGPPDRLAAPTYATAYPRLQEMVNVSLARPAGDAVEVVADWGDGAQTRADWPANGSAVLAHAYDQSGGVDAAFSAVFLDGSRATRIVHFDVGGSPPQPPRLNFLQRSFSTENQNVTFFVLGLAVTLLASLVGLLARRRARGRIPIYMRRLEDIRQRGASDPSGALRDLGALRGAVEADLLAGRLTEDQHHFLQTKATGLMRRLLADLVSPVERLSQSFRDRLEAALLDGRLAPHEARDMQRLLALEAGADKGQRQRLAAFLARELGGDAAT